MSKNMIQNEKSNGSNGFLNIPQNNIIKAPPPTFRRIKPDKTKPSNNCQQDQADNNNEAHFKREIAYQVKPIVTHYKSGFHCNCFPISREIFTSKDIEKKPLIDLINLEQPYGCNVFTRKFNYLSYILQKNMPFKYPKISIEVLKSEKVSDALRKAAVSDYIHKDEAEPDDIELKPLLKRHIKRAKIIIYNMEARISNYMLKFAAWGFHHIIKQLVTSICVHTDQLDMILKANKQDRPLIFLPTHKSHLDYLLVSFMLFHKDVKVPHVAAGDNLSISFFGWLLNCLGGFFIRRRLDKKEGVKDHVYRAVLHVYMQELLKRNANFEFFLEGGRSRSGKVAYPKAGLLSVILDSFHDQSFQDVLMVPISINYDKILDGNFTKEQMGERKVSESFFRAVKSIWCLFRSRYGHVRIDIGQPFSLKEFDVAYPRNLNGITNSLENYDRGDNSYHHSLSFSDNLEASDVMHIMERSSSFKKRHRQSSSSLFGTDVVIKEKEAKNEVVALAEHIVYNIVSIQSIMSTEILAFLLLYKFRQGCTSTEMCQSYKRLQDELSNHGRNLGFSGDVKNVVKYASLIFDDKVVEKSIINGETFLKPNLDLPNVFELSYYSNSVVYVYALESVLATVLLSKIKVKISDDKDSSMSIEINRDEIFEETKNLCKLLKYDFILCPVCLSWESVIDTKLQLFLDKDIIKTVEDNYNVGVNSRRVLWANRFADEFGFSNDDDDDDDDDDVADEALNDFDCGIKYSVNFTEKKTERQLTFLKSILEPYFECYIHVLSEFKMLLDGDKLENDVLKTIHENIKKRAIDGDLRYTECAAFDMVKTAFRSFNNRNVIDIYLDGKVRKCGLSCNFKTAAELRRLIDNLKTYYYC